MNDDWRLRVTLHEHEHADRLAGRLAASEIEEDAGEYLGDRVIVSRDGAELFFYAATRDQTDRAHGHVETIAREHGLDAQFELTHWHPDSEEWEAPEEPLPTSDAERDEEHEELIERERVESAEQGYPEFEVRVVCATRHDAAAFAQRLEDENVPTARRWRYLVVGALDEDSAQGLAERLRAEAPDGSEVTVEASANATLDARPPNPYSVFGGLGG